MNETLQNRRINNDSDNFYLFLLLLLHHHHDLVIIVISYFAIFIETHGGFSEYDVSNQIQDK